VTAASLSFSPGIWRTDHKLLHLAWAAVLLAVGCDRYKPLGSPYAPLYERDFHLRCPSHQETKACGQSWTVNRPVDQVWRACLDTSTQYNAILHCGRDDSGGRQLIFVSGTYVMAHRTEGVLAYMEVWIAVSAAVAAPGQTEVAAAWISPETRTAASTGQAVSSEPGASGPAGLDSPATFRMPLLTLSRAFGKANRTGEVGHKRELIAEIAINRFFQELGLMMFGPDRWRHKLAGHAESKPERKE